MKSFISVYMDDAQISVSDYFHFHFFYLLQKPWTKILPVVNVGPLEKSSNQLKFFNILKEPKNDPKATAKLILTTYIAYSVFRLAIPAFQVYRCYWIYDRNYNII